MRAEFRQHASLPRSNVLLIEYLYRHGRRQFQLLRSGHSTALGSFLHLWEETEEPSSRVGPGNLPEDGDNSRSPLDSMRSPETPPKKR